MSATILQPKEIKVCHLYHDMPASWNGCHKYNELNGHIEGLLPLCLVCQRFQWFLEVTKLGLFIPIGTSFCSKDN